MKDIRRWRHQEGGKKSHNTWHAFLQPSYVNNIHNEARKMNIRFLRLLSSRRQLQSRHIFSPELLRKNTLSLTSKQRWGQNSIQSMISIYPNDFNFEFSLTFGHQRRCFFSAVLPYDSSLGLRTQAFQEIYTRCAGEISKHVFENKLEPYLNYF